MRQGFERAFAQLDAIEAPLSVAVAEPTARAQLEALVREFKGLRLLVAEQLAPALGLLIGFNAMDGDG